MKHQELISAIDNEINMHIERSEDFDIGELVDSYCTKEEYKPILQQYVKDVYQLYAKIDKKLAKDACDVGDGIGCLGIIISTGISASIGGCIGYLVGNKTGDYASTGAVIGLFAEIFLSPSATFLAYLYVKSELKECEAPREIYRKRAILKLKQL